MARYDGNNGLFTTPEFKGRGVIKLAPDAFVYINRALQGVFHDPIKKQTRTVDFQNAITSISVQNNIDPPGSSTATIELTTPIYDEKTSLWVPFYYDSQSGISLRPYFTTMMEIHVYFKGRFLVDSVPKYYPAFWGFITNVEESFSNGAYKITLQCADMLHWWQYIQIAFRPSVEGDIFVQGLQGITAMGTRFNAKNPFEIIYALCQAMGYENVIPPSFVAKQTSDPKTRSIDKRWLSVYYNAFKYWNDLFSGSFGTNNLKMYGTAGDLITVDTMKYPKQAKGTDRSKEGTKDNVSELFNVDQRLRNYDLFFQFANMGKGLEEAEYKTKLEVATELKNRVEYEFYQDVNGNFIFKPPFYNLNVKTIYPYTIKPQDIISFSAMENSEEIVTALEVQVSPSDQINDAAWINMTGYHVDMDLVKRYGFRYKTMTPWWMSEARVARSYAVGEMGLMNAKAHTGSITIPGRPELRLGYPIYMSHNDRFYYVKAINHAFDYGGSFTTTLSLEAERLRYYDPDTYQIKPNLAYKYKMGTENDTIQIQADLIRAAIDKEAINNNNRQRVESELKTAIETANRTIARGKTVTLKVGETNLNRYLTKDPQKNLEILKRAAGMVASTEPGLYSIETDPSIVSISQMAVPLTDEEGYRVVGGFRYGRGLGIQPGQAILPDESPDLGVAPIDLDKTPTYVMGMSPEADKEGEEMATYFEKSNQAGVEGAVPTYAKFPDNAAAPKPVTNQIDMNIRDMAPAGTKRDAPDNTFTNSPSIG